LDTLNEKLISSTLPQPFLKELQTAAPNQQKVRPSKFVLDTNYPNTVSNIVLTQNTGHFCKATNHWYILFKYYLNALIEDQD